MENATATVVDRGERAATTLLERLQLITVASSLGGVETLATRPSATSHRDLSAAQRRPLGIRARPVVGHHGTRAVGEVGTERHGDGEVERRHLGAIVGSTAAGAVGLPAGLLGLAALFVVRAVVAALRRHGLDRFVDNRPILLVRDGHFLDDNLTLAKVTRDDVHEGLRLAGVTRLEQVGAVIIERNGELSVLRGAHADVDRQLMHRVVGADPAG